MIAINKNTLQIVGNVSPIDLDQNWIQNPTLPECLQRYWKIDGDNVVEMSEAEKTQKDIDDPITPLIDRAAILKRILSAVDPGDQLSRMLDAIDKYSSFTVALDGQNIDMAIARMDKALANADITQDDYDIVVAILNDYK